FLSKKLFTPYMLTPVTIFWNVTGVLSVPFGIGQQGDSKTCALLWFAPYRNFTSVSLHDLFGDGQPGARMMVLFARVALAENQRLLFRRNVRIAIKDMNGYV